jgi:hydroxyethylthiazole kinase
MNLTANALLALGASPVMAHAAEEVDEMVGLAAALVLNIGTLSPPWVTAMLRAGNAARRKGIPIVFDPVGAGATRFRTETARRLLRDLRPAVLRGNASEIRALGAAGSGTKGVDSRHAPEDALESARRLSAEFGGAVSVSGPVDIIVQGEAVVRTANGHPLMSRVTGLGCVASALTGAFAAVDPSPLSAAAHAMAVCGIAGEIAGEGAAGPGSFEARFLDALYNLSEADIAARLKMDVA